MNFLHSLKSMFAPAPRVEPTDAGPRIHSGAAVLVDVREPREWQSGVAEGAALLPLSDLTGPRTQWSEFLARHREHEILLYCASGMRSARATQILTTEGFKAANAGALSDWANRGWRIVPPSR